jgi:hypothetical protein
LRLSCCHDPYTQDREGESWTAHCTQPITSLCLAAPLRSGSKGGYRRLTRQNGTRMVKFPRTPFYCRYRRERPISAVCTPQRSTARRTRKPSSPARANERFLEFWEGG